MYTNSCSFQSGYVIPNYSEIKAVSSKETLSTELDHVITSEASVTMQNALSKEPWERLKEAFDAGSDQALMQECFNEFLADPLPYMEKNVKEDEMYLKGFTFHYCACPAWARDKNKIRQKAETIIVEDIDKRHENKSETIHIGSFGAGGLLQDLIIVGKLIQKGFKNIRMVFVDSNPDRDNAEKFSAMLNKLPEVNIQAIYAPFFGSKVKLDAIYSTDLNSLNKSGGECWMDVFMARDNALTDSGKFYLFGDNIQLILDKNNNLQDLHDGSDTFFEEFFTSSKLPDLSKANPIKIIVAKDNRQKLNFNCPRIAKVVQILSKQFNKPIDIQLYGNDIFNSASRLNGWANTMVLEKLSGKVASLSVTYLKEECSLQQQVRATYHIFIRELENGGAKTSFAAI